LDKTTLDEMAQDLKDRFFHPALHLVLRTDVNTTNSLLACETVQAVASSRASNQTTAEHRSQQPLRSLRPLASAACGAVEPGSVRRGRGADAKKGLDELRAKLA
jgi:hypothetical protein